MQINIKNKSFLTLMDFTQKEIYYMLDLAKKLKRQKYDGIQGQSLKGKNIILLFEKDSTRTRCAFEVAAYDEGANVTCIGSVGSQMCKKESIKDTARVLGSMYDGIEYRGYSQRTVEELAKYSGVPVWNGLTDEDHPTQVLADFLTIQEHIDKSLKEVSFAYIGDGRNNIANALMIGASKIGMDYRVVCPKELSPDKKLLGTCLDISKGSGGSIIITDDIKHGVKNVDVIYTDVWVSMGEDEEEWENRIELLKPYQVNMDMIKMTENEEVIFQHCLPAFHNLETKVAKEINKKFNLKEMEVTDEVFESKYSVVFDEAENRLHTIKAVMVATLGR